MEKNLETKIYEVLTEAGVPVKQAKKMAKKTAEKAEFFIWEKKNKKMAKNSGQYTTQMYGDAALAIAKLCSEDRENKNAKKDAKKQKRKAAEMELDKAIDKAVDATVGTITDSKLDKMVDKAVDATDAALGQILDETMSELFGPKMGKMIGQVKNKIDEVPEDEMDKLVDNAVDAAINKTLPELSSTEVPSTKADAATKEVATEVESPVCEASDSKPGKISDTSDAKTTAVTGNTNAATEKQQEDWPNLKNGKRNNDSVITPRLDAGVVTRLKMNLRSPSCALRSGHEELCSELSIYTGNESCKAGELSPSPQGLTNDDEVGAQSVYGVSDSPYTSSNHQTDGQPNCSGSDCLQHSFPDGKPGRGLPSIDEKAEKLCDDIYRKICLVENPEEFISNVKALTTEANVLNMRTADKASVFCGLLMKHANLHRMMQVRTILGLDEYKFEKEMEDDTVKELLQEYSRYCFRQMPLIEQLKEYYGESRTLEQVAKEQEALAGNITDTRKRNDIETANRNYAQTEYYTLSEDIPGVYKNTKQETDMLFKRMYNLDYEEDRENEILALEKTIYTTGPDRAAVFAAYFKTIKKSSADDLEKLKAISDIVKVGASPCDAYLFDDFERFDPCGVCILKLAKALGLLEIDPKYYDGIEPMKFVLDLI